MSKKLIIITSVVLGLFLLALVGYYFIIQGNESSPDGPLSKFKNFFPFGGSDLPAPTSSGKENENRPPEQSSQTNFTQKLRKLSMEPVAGATILDSKAGSIVRHIEKATGHIFETELFSPRQARISNTTIPTVYDALWGNKSLSLVARYLKEDDQTIDTYSLTIKEVATSTENTISGIPFPANIKDVAAFGGNLFYLVETSDYSVGYTSSWSGAGRKQIWSSAIKELLSQYVNSRTVALTTKPEADVFGFLYFVDTSSGQVRQILGKLNSLSTLVSPDASQVLYMNQKNGLQMSVYNLSSKSTSLLSPITFPEKCLWSSKDKNVIYCAVPKEFLGAESLVSWYKGMSSYTDDIWKYDIKNNTSSMIEDLSADSGEPIDVIKPILSDNEQYLIFINKRDNSLWSLDLNK